MAETRQRLNQRPARSKSCSEQKQGLILDGITVAACTPDWQARELNDQGEQDQNWYQHETRQKIFSHNYPWKIINLTIYKKERRN